MLNVGEIRNAKQKEPKDGALTPGAPYVSDFNSTQKKERLSCNFNNENVATLVT